MDQAEESVDRLAQWYDHATVPTDLPMAALVVALVASAVECSGQSDQAAGHAKAPTDRLPSMAAEVAEEEEERAALETREQVPQMAAP